MQGHDSVIVIGAGIVGLSAALWAQRMGCRVTLIDRQGPGAGASHGNAGLIASAAVVPVPVPGLWAKAPGMLLNPEKPLFVRWPHLPRALPFLLRYLRNGRTDRVERISAALTQLLHDAPDQHTALAAGTGAARFVRAGRYVVAYRDRAEYDGDAFGWALRRRMGFDPVEHDAASLAALDPALGSRFGFGVELPAHGLITDPGGYVAALAETFTQAGGTIDIATASGFRLSQGRAVALVTDRGDMQADAYVLTTGAWSGPIARALGIAVPLETERGYHLEFRNASVMPGQPTMIAAGKFVASPMDGRLRCAGVVEYGGLNAGPSEAPFRLLERNVARIFPDLRHDGIDRWMGHRPVTADSLPVIGAAPRAANVFVGYGHQHVGLTGGPKTGRWLAQMLTGQPANEDLSAYSPARRG